MVKTAAGLFHYEVQLIDVDTNAEARLKELAGQR